MITVFRNTDATEDVVCTVSDDNATYSAALMGKDEIVVDVVTQAVLPVSVLDYIRYGGYAYTLNRQPEFTKEADVKYRYNLVFEGAIYNLLDKGFEHPITKQTRFTLTGTLRDFVQLAVDNANLTDSGWSVGDVPDTPRKNIVFESMTVGDVLDKLATEFSVEYHSLGKRISFYDRYENITQIVFKQGMGNGLFTLTRRNVDSENTVTRAVLYGGTKNLPLGYRNGSEYLRWADPATGNMYVENFSDYPKVVERDVYFDDVYPHFEGGLDGVRGDHHEIVRCAAIDFDVNDYMIGDVKAKINFITGDLTGNDFEFNYNHATHEVTLIRKEDDTVLPDAEGNRPLIPNDNKRPQIGDQINFTDITMPQAYVTRFENQLHDKGVEWLAINSQLRVKFELSIDHRYLRREGISLKIGDVVRIQVPEDGIDRQLRIISLEKRLKDGSITCEVSNFLRHSWEKEVEGKLMAARDKAEIIRSEVLYDLNASKEWTARHFARLAGGNRLSGDQDIEGNVKVTKDISGDNIHAEKDISAGRKISAQAGEIVDITSENIETEVLKVLDKIIAKDQTLSGKISSADFLSGLLGYGWRIDNAGRAEMHSLTLRESLDVPKLRYNRVQVIGSEMWVTEGGAISDVQSSGSQYVVTLKLEEGDLNPFRPADILKGIYHTGTGFQTVMLRVDAVSDDGAMTVTPRYPQLLPQKFMDVARIGNFTDKERQRSILISSKEGRILILGDVDGWDVQPRMVKMIFGDTSGFIHPEFGDMSGYNAFLENILMTGRIYQKSADGQTLKPVPVNKGAWEPGSYYYYDEVTRNGCLWLCTAGSTTAEPAEGSPDWIKRVDKGADGAKGDKGDQGLRGLQGEKGDRGIQGEKGADGLTSYFHIKYSPVENPTAAQMTEEPDVYIGTYVDYTPADSDDPSKYAWMRFQGLQGDAGEKGIPGVNGADGKTSFLHIKYSDDGQTFTANNGETPGAWIGQYTDFTEADSSVFSRYAWTKIKGDKGDKGDPGKDGIQGTPGAILRSRGVWKPSEVYIRSAEFIDWVVYGAQKYRYVVKSGVATVPAGILPTNTAYWTAFNEMEPVAAPMFLGETASFDVVGSQAIRVLEDDSSEYGWMLTGGKILHTRTGLALNASGKIEAPDGLAIEMSGKSLEEWTQQKADAAKQAAIDAAAADAADKVNAVRIGGVNILNGTKNFSDHWSGEGQILSEQYLGLNVVYCKVPTSADYAEVRQQVNVPFTPSEEYTLSFWAKGEGYVHTYCHPVISQRIIATNGDASVGSAVDTRMRYVLTSEWKRFFVTFLTLGTVSPSGDNRVLFRVHSGNNEVYLCGAKLEQGNKDTAYSISDNDQKEYSDKAVDAVQFGISNLISGGKRISGTATAPEIVKSGMKVENAHPGEVYTASFINNLDNLVRIFIGQKKSTGSYLGDFVGSVAGKGEKSVVTCTMKEGIGYFVVGIWNKNGDAVTPIGDYDVSDMMVVQGNKAPGGWVPSVEEVQDQIDAAQESADGANAMLADIASDDKLTPNEKQDAKREWDIIQGEKPILTAQADAIQLSTADYLNVYNALSAYITPLLADMTTTSTITGSVFNARFKTYYDAKTTLLKNIQYYSSGQFRITTIDATALDPDTYYPVTFTLYNATDYKATFDIGTVLGTSGKPPWATHAQGFSCNCAWESNGNRWGTLPVKRYIHSFAYSFAESTPVGSIGQVIEISMEYIYVRGGGRYTVRTSGFPFIELHPSGYHWTSGSSSGDLPTRTSVETPVVDVEAAKTTAQSALGAANALSTTVTGLKNFTDSAFADGVVTRSEAAAIGKLTNQVAETAESVKAQYYNRYNHADLNETGKRNLAAKYALFDAAKAALLTSITTAIADGIATAAEQADVDTKHNAFNSALSDLNVAFGVADEAIRDAIRAYADSAVGTGQNAVAKNIGFSSYEDMTAKAEAGQTIMNGGRINTDLIETATLIAENLITKPASDSDQRRIEIRRETNALTAYDSAGNTVLLVKGDTVDDVDTLINPTAVSLSSDFTPRSFSWSASSELEKYESAVCAELAVTSAGFYKISIPDIRAEHLTHCAAGAYSYGRMDFVLTTSDASEVLAQIPVAKGNAENWITHVRAGTYTVYAKSRLYLRVRFYGRLEGYASALASESMNVKLYTASQKVTCTGSTDSAMRTSLFANGLAATYSNQEYFVVFKGGAGIPYIMGRGDTRLLSKSGKYGLRLTDSGVLATSNSTNDNNWGALMHGLAAWGIVNTGTGTIAKYWTSPAGNITALTAAAGGTGYVTITMFGSGFTSTSSYAVDAKPNNTNDRIVYASVQNKKTTSFKIGTGDGAGSVATDVVFFIFNLDTYKY